MPQLTVRRTGNSLSLLVPRPVADRLHLTEGEIVNAEIERIDRVADLAGSLKGVVSARELHRLSNEGEDLG